VLMILEMRGFRSLSRSVSLGSASFHERMNAAITGHTHSGESLHFSPATKATASITQNVESGECAPDFKESPSIFRILSSIICTFTFPPDAVLPARVPTTSFALGLLTTCLHCRAKNNYRLRNLFSVLWADPQ